jgi:hypothetical protein
MRPIPAEHRDAVRKRAIAWRRVARDRLRQDPIGRQVAPLRRFEVALHELACRIGSSSAPAWREAGAEVISASLARPWRARDGTGWASITACRPDRILTPACRRASELGWSRPAWHTPAAIARGGDPLDPEAQAAAAEADRAARQAAQDRELEGQVRAVVARLEAAIAAPDTLAEERARCRGELPRFRAMLQGAP